jgi:hypothetical protein
MIYLKGFAGGLGAITLAVALQFAFGIVWLMLGHGQPAGSSQTAVSVMPFIPRLVGVCLILFGVGFSVAVRYL